MLFIALIVFSVIFMLLAIAEARVKYLLTSLCTLIPIFWVYVATPKQTSTNYSVPVENNTIYKINDKYAFNYINNDGVLDLRYVNSIDYSPDNLSAEYSYTNNKDMGNLFLLFPYNYSKEYSRKLRVGPSTVFIKK